MSYPLHMVQVWVIIKIFSSIYFASREIIEVNVAYRQTDKKFEAINGCMSGHSYKPLKGVIGSLSHPVRPQSRGAKGQEPTTGKMVKKWLTAFFSFS